jgi:hypothetical protein
MKRSRLPASARRDFFQKKEGLMKRSLSATLVAGLGLVLLGGFAPALLAHEHHSCSMRDVAATYGYTVNGTRNGVGLAASVGTVTLDTSGNLVGTQTASFAGTIVTETLSGTYTVNDDCTGSAVINVVSSIPAFNRISDINLVWDDDGEKLRFIFTNSGTILTGDGQQMH